MRHTRTRAPVWCWEPLVVAPSPVSAVPVTRRTQPGEVLLSLLDLPVLPEEMRDLLAGGDPVALALNT